jgi:CubicO group peptidase (beta-lactamase class C family)
LFQGELQLPGEIRMKSVDSLIQPYMVRGDILGAAVAILQDGEIIYQGGFGTTSVEQNGVAVTPHTLFAYGSISKTLCATLIMRLVERGLLDLDGPVRVYLPDLLFSDPEYGRQITLRHLLSHTSGLPMAGKYWGPCDPDSLRRFVYEQIPDYAFLSAPGSVHLYSNTVFCIAGHIAEAVTGKVYPDLMQEYVFDPLHMDRTTYDLSVAITYPVALPHESDADSAPRTVHRIAQNASGNPSSFALGSLTDLAHLAQMYLNQGRFADQQFLLPSSIAEMHRPLASRHIEGHAHPLAYVNQGYGLGFNVGHYQGRRAARHGGMSQSYNCFFDLFPDDRAGVVLLTNYSHEERLMELVAALYDYALGLPHQGLVFLEKPPTLDPLPGAGQLERFLGTYLNVESADLAAFDVAADELVMERQGKSLPLIPFDVGCFFGQVSEQYRVPVAFLQDSGGKITHVMIAGEPYFPIVFDPDFQPDLDLWKEYESVYQDPSNTNPEELFTVRLRDGELYISEGQHEVPSRALSNRCFLSDLGLIEFEDIPAAGVKGLVWGKATRYWRVD